MATIAYQITQRCTEAREVINTAWRNAMVQIRTHRLAAKARVRAGEVDAALADWADFAAAMRLQLGV